MSTTRSAAKPKTAPAARKTREAQRAAPRAAARKAAPATRPKRAASAAASAAASPPAKKAAPPRRRAEVSGDANSIRDQVIAFKREQIILAAVDLFFVNGYQQTTLEEVARQLNVTKPFIYYHFKDKEELLYEISQRAVRDANKTLEVALDREGTPTQRLHWATKTLMKAIIEKQRYTAVFFREQKNLSEQSRGPVYALHHEYDKLLIKLLDEGVRKGEFVVADTHLCALGLSGMTGWTYNWYRPDGRLSVDQICELMAELALRTVGVAPEVIRSLAEAG